MSHFANQPTRVSVRAAADHFGVTPQTIYSWIKQGLLDAERVGPHLIRVDVASLQTTRLGGDAL
jgi:excisionase family DNA binding protein